jgi:hypothetical protein
MKRRAHTVALACTAVVAIAIARAAAADEERFVAKLALPTGQTAVVAEGDYEARSIGSYSVRLYASSGGGPNADPADATFFVAGLIEKRGGTIEAVRVADVDRDGRDEIVVIIRSVGTGSYLTAHAFAFGEKRLEMRAMVVGLAKDADPIAALAAATQRGVRPN